MQLSAFRPVTRRVPDQEKAMLHGIEVAGPASVPGQPVDAQPGSPRKIQVLTERAARGEKLFHPDDTPGIGSAAITALPAVAWQQTESA